MRYFWTIRSANRNFKVAVCFHRHKWRGNSREIWPKLLRTGLSTPCHTFLRQYVEESALRLLLWCLPTPRFPGPPLLPPSGFSYKFSHTWLERTFLSFSNSLISDLVFNLRILILEFKRKNTGSHTDGVSMTLTLIPWKKEDTAHRKISSHFIKLTSLY